MSAVEDGASRSGPARRAGAGPLHEAADRDGQGPGPGAVLVPRRPASDADLDFVRRPMVRWLDPHQLLDTAARVLGSGFSTAFTDTREFQGLLAGGVIDRSSPAESWIDYVSDLGDGWNSTYSVANLLVREELELRDGSETYATRRGSLLLLGGDQVYPVPTCTEYRNRFLGPYRSAMPCAPPGEQPELFAIPGSHDWYDGLANFSSIFCRQRPIGGWRTTQTRSYFALKLPHHWWVVGIDLQFGEYLDEAQLAYFKDAAREMEPGDQVVVCLAKEVDSGRKNSEVCSDRNLEHLETEILEPAGARVRLYLKSGRHYYARYRSKETGAHLVTAGGGGAFLHPTHALPEVAEPPGRADAGPFRKAVVYPSAKKSRSLRRRIWLLPAYNLPLAAVLGAMQVLLAFMLNLHLDGRHRNLSVGEVTRAFLESPSAFLLIIVIVLSFAAMIRLAHDAGPVARLLIGTGHFALQFIGLGLVIVVASQLVSGLGGASLAAFLGLVWVFGGAGAVLGISGYLWASNHLGYHANEAYAPLHHSDQKNFLRLHLGPDGVLSVYAVGIDRVVRKWRFRPDAPVHEPWLEPAGGGPQHLLIEPPLRLHPDGAGRDRD